MKTTIGRVQPTYIAFRRIGASMGFVGLQFLQCAYTRFCYEARQRIFVIHFRWIKTQLWKKKMCNKMLNKRNIERIIIVYIVYVI